MLEDLDSLASRLGQLVQSTRSLQDERAGLLARIKSLEEQCNALRTELSGRQTDYDAMSQRVAEHDQHVRQMQLQFEHDTQSLKEQAVRAQTQADHLAERLQATQESASMLRQAAQHAKARVDSILERLPGAAHQE